LTRSPNFRIGAAVAAGFVPPALALAIFAAIDVIYRPWAILAVAVGVAIGVWSAFRLGKSWSGRAEQIAELAEALEAHHAPPHLLPDEGGGAIDRAERRMLSAVDEAVAEMDLLAEQRDEFEAILRSMSEAVVVTGAHGEVMLLNRPARAMFGLNPEASYRGRDFVELCRDPRLQEFVARSKTAAGGQVMSAEFFIQNPFPRYLAVSAAPVRRSDGGAFEQVFVFHDITQLKSYETARADFVANLTHEIRTPLAALCGYAETLTGGVENKETERRFLGIIERQARRLGRLVDDLLSLSDLERGVTPLNFEELDPRGVLEEAAEVMREPAARGGLALNVVCPPDLPRLSGDRDRLQQVMLNLLDNAIKYTPRGGTVTVEARARTLEEEPPRAGVDLVVSDTGEGIPAADIPRLTERFYRVDRARSRELGGTGLGLAIVKHIVQLHHGTLRIASRLREGTTVELWIPSA
jgi:two-component system, OmpR family, phosphate regulon sensor histidine kinase PhoR